MRFESAQPVRIIRERDPFWAMLIRELIFTVLYYPLAGLIFTSIAGTVTDWGLSWWHSVLIVYGAHLLQRSNLAYQRWTTEATS